MMIAFVILQYNVYESTFKSVASIMANTKVDYQIIVVDNCSENDSFDQIKSRFTGDNRIHCIQTTKNLGFANGNNFGIEYATKNFNFEWICVMNNDVYLTSMLTEPLLETLNNDEVDVLGPNIISLHTSEHQNPLPAISYSKFYIYKMIWIYRIYLILNYLHLDYYLHQLAIKILTSLNKTQANRQGLQHESEAFVKKIHGSVLMFHKKFISKFPKPFHPDTFMYLEEDFLALRCERSGSSIYYLPSLTFEHDHSQTVNKLTKNSHEKSKYIFKHNIASYQAFLNYYKSQDL